MATHDGSSEGRQVVCSPGAATLNLAALTAVSKPQAGVQPPAPTIAATSAKTAVTPTSDHVALTSFFVSFAA